MSSRMGARTARALVLRTVRLATWETCLASETAMVYPSRTLVWSMTWTSELPSPT